MKEKADFILAGGEIGLFFFSLFRQQALNKNHFVSGFTFESSLKALKIPYHSYK